MMELAGIDMLPPEAGTPVIRRELTAGATRGEIVVANRLGALMNDWDPTGSLDTTAAEAAFHGPMIAAWHSSASSRGFAWKWSSIPRRSHS